MREEIIKKDFYQLLKLEEIKHLLRISGNFEDGLLNLLKDSVIAFAESYLEQEILLKEFRITGVFTKNITLKTPFVSVISIKSKGEDINYKLNKNILMPDLKSGDEFVLHYLAGMLEGEVTPDLKLALLQHLANVYDERDSRGKIPVFTFQVYERYRKIKL